MGPSSSIVEHEFLDVFLQPFSFEQKAECHVQESSGKYCWRRFGGGETETGEIGVKEPPERKANLSERFGCSEQPGGSRVGSGFCFMERQETGARQQPRPNNTFRFGHRKLVRSGECASSGGTRKLVRGDDNSTICKSPTIDILRKSSRTCDKSGISMKTHQYST